VLEHIRNIDGLLDEAFRTLKPGGLLLIEVPDAESYARHPIGSAFWVTIREHVNHYSACSLTRALQRHGFSVTRVATRVLPTPEFSYPSLMVLGQKTGAPEPLQPFAKGAIGEYVLTSKRALARQAGTIASLIAGTKKVAFWGLSAELLSLLPLLDLRQATLCDSSTAKQQATYRGHPIVDPQGVKPEGTLVVAPYLHGDSIARTALQLGWRSDAIHRLT
jgi:hypothetical protein